VRMTIGWQATGPEHAAAHHARTSRPATGRRRGAGRLLRRVRHVRDGARELLLPSSHVQTALDRLRGNDVRYRFVLDLSDLD